MKEAFHVMYFADRVYWTPSSSFTTAAADVMKAARDVGYSEQDVKNAFVEVGIAVGERDI